MMKLLCIFKEVSLLNFYENTNIICYRFIALDLSKENKRNYGDEITYQMRLARKKRWNALEEKRISEEIKFQSYLNQLIQMDKENQLTKLAKDIENKVVTDENVIKNLEKMINTTFDERILAVNDLFAQIDDKRKVFLKILIFIFMKFLFLEARSS